MANHDLTPTEIGALRRRVNAGVTATTLPAASSLPVGTKIRRSDLGYQEFYTDGTYWRPTNGRALWAKRNGSINTPINTVTGTTGAFFTLPSQIVFPAGSIPTHSSVHISCLLVRTGTGGTGKINVRLGTTGTTTDPAVTNMQLANVTGTAANPRVQAHFGTTTSRFTTNQDGVVNGFGTNTATDKAAGVDTTVPMYVTFELTNLTAADSYALLAYEVWLEA